MAQASAEKLEQIGPAEKERVFSVPQREQLARTPEPPLKKGKGTEPSVQSTRSWGERVKVGESRTLARRGGLEREHGEERVFTTVNEGRFKGEREGKLKESPEKR